jgi:hypothetical protein
MKIYNTKGNIAYVPPTIIFCANNNAYMNFGITYST